MHESRDRRSALRRLAAIVAAGSGAFGLRAGASAEADAARHGKKQRRVEFAYDSGMADVTFTPHPDGDDAHWTIRGRQVGDAEVEHMRSGQRDAMSAVALHDLMMAKSGGGSMNGSPMLSVGGMNWRVATASLDAGSGEWTIDARVCDSNPDARPSSAAVRGGWSQQPVSGCNCSGCNNRCYVCADDKRRCGRSYCSACQGCW